MARPIAIQKRIGFSTEVTVLRPPPGQTWLLRSAIEVGSAGQLNLTDGTTTEQFSTGDTRNPIALTNDWYLSCAASTATTGFILTLELGFGAYSFREQHMRHFSLSAANVRTLNTTERTLIASPGAGRAIQLIDLQLTVGATAFGGIAADEDLEIRYEDESGPLIGTIETTGFLDTANEAFTFTPPDGVELVKAQPIVIANSGAITGGSDVAVVARYYVV